MNVCVQVGYGDEVPTTPAGKFVAAVIMHCGLLLLALPVTVMGEMLTRDMSRHDREMRDKRKQDAFLMRRTVRRIVKQQAKQIEEKKVRICCLCEFLFVILLAGF